MITRIAAAFGSSTWVVNGWSISGASVATADTARVSSRAYGAACAARCWALTIREDAISSIARVTFLVVVTAARR